MTSLKTSIKTITYLSDIGCLEIQGASLGVYVDEGIDIESAYKYSMKVYKSNEDKSPFCNVREMTDTVQNYYHEYGGNDTCPLCTKHIDD
nr:hypothetical protein [Escherichia coli]